MENVELLQAIQEMMGKNMGQLREEMHQGFTHVSSRLDNLETKVDRLETKVDNLETRMGKLETAVTKTNVMIENEINPKIKLLFEGQCILQDKYAQIAKMEATIQEMQSVISTLTQVVAWHSEDIRVLKRRR